jgi:hypothetical protein
MCGHEYDGMMSDQIPYMVTLWRRAQSFLSNRQPLGMCKKFPVVYAASHDVFADALVLITIAHESEYL